MRTATTTCGEQLQAGCTVGASATAPSRHGCRWTLALIRSWEAYGNASYLTAAETIFADLVGPWNALNTTCGGMNWDKGNDYVNAITNELFFTAAARLAAVTGSSQPVGGKTYLQWAQTQWSWLLASAMVQPNGLFQVSARGWRC